MRCLISVSAKRDIGLTSAASAGSIVFRMVSMLVNALFRLLNWMAARVQRVFTSRESPAANCSSHVAKQGFD